MEKQNKINLRLKVCALLLVLTVLAGCFVVFGNDAPMVKAQNKLVVDIHSSVAAGADGTVKLIVNQTCFFSANVADYVGALRYEWRFDDMVISNSSVCEYTFTQADEALHVLSVKVVDEAESVGYASLGLKDPFASYDLYLNTLASSSDYILEPDDLGWYQVFSGKTGVATGAASSNSTLATATILGSMTSGTLLLKGVSFDLALMNSIPRNVSVIENVNGLSRTFINPLDAQGSPYTISVNGANYFAADAKNRICWTSTNADGLITTTLQNGDYVRLTPGIYMVNWIHPSFSNKILEGSGRDNTFLVLKNNTQKTEGGINGIQILNSQNFTLRGFTLNGDFLNRQNYAYTQSGLEITNSSHGLIEDCIFKNWQNNGVNIVQWNIATGNSYDITVRNNKFINCLWNGFSVIHNDVSGSVYNIDVYGNYFEGSNDVALDTSVIGNTGSIWGINYHDNFINGHQNYPNRGNNNGSSNWGIGLEGGSGITVQNNQIWDISYGIKVYGTAFLGAGRTQYGNNTIIDNTIWLNSTLNAYEGIALVSNDNIARGNTIYGGYNYSQCISIGGNNSVVEYNKLIKAGTQQSWGIKENPDGIYPTPNNPTIRFNDVSTFPTGYGIVLSTGTGRVIYGNNGYDKTGVDRLRGIVPSQAGWDFAPANLSYSTDGLISTVTSVADDNLGTWAFSGTYIWDMGVTCNVNVGATITYGTSANTGIRVYLYGSVDGVTYKLLATSTSTVDPIVMTENITCTLPSTFMIDCRYVKLTASSTDGPTHIYLSVADIRAIDIGA